MSRSSSDEKTSSSGGWGIGTFASGLGNIASGVADMTVNAVSAVGDKIGITSGDSDADIGTEESVFDSEEDSEEDDGSDIEIEAVEEKNTVFREVGMAGESDSGASKQDTNAATKTPGASPIPGNSKKCGRRKSGGGKKGSKRKSIGLMEMEIDEATRLPLAGSSMFRRRCDKADLIGNENSDQFVNTWSSCEAGQFQLRVGPNYKKTGKKAASGPSLYEAVGLDMISSKERIINIASQVKLPEEWTNVETNHPEVPPVFVSVCQLPEVGPNLLSGVSSFFVDKSEGPGQTVVSYFRIKPETCEALKDLSSAPPAVKLFANFCANATDEDSEHYYANPKSTYAGRFKVIPMLDNMEELGLPRFITMYNAKPALIAKCGLPYRTKDYLCFDSNVHAFGGPARTAMQVMSFDSMYLNMGFCIEARDDPEMPEVMLGCVYLHRLNTDKGSDWEATIKASKTRKEHSKTPVTSHTTQAELDSL